MKAVAVVVAVAALGTAARLSTWQEVFTGDGVELVPADSHYYLRFAELQRSSWPRFTAVDGWVNFPGGARIIWPWGHTLLVAVATAGDEPERAAAWVGPALSLLWLLGLGAVLVRCCSVGEVALVLGALAVTPAAVESGALGTADHHVHEPFLAALWLVLARRVLVSGAVGPAVALGVVLGLARGLTTIGFSFIPVAAVVLAVGLRGAPRGRVLTIVGAVAAVTWEAQALWLGTVDRLAYEEPGSFPALLTLAVFLGGAALRGEQHRVALGTAAVGALALIAPQLGRALAQLAVKDPLLEVIVESRPLWKDLTWAVALMGPLLPLLAVAGPGVVRGHRAERAAAVAGVLALGLAMMQARFAQAAVGAVAMACAPAAARVLAASPRRWSLFAVAFLTLGVPEVSAPSGPGLARRVRPTLEWIAHHTPTTPPRAVLANYVFGHWIVLWARRPAVSSTFSQLPWHLKANRAAGEVLTADDEAAAAALARALDVGWILATPFVDIPGFPRAREGHGLLDQLSAPDATARIRSHFRLVFTSVERRRDTPGPLARVYELVSGARLVGPCPLATEGALTISTEVEGEPVHATRPVRCQPGGSLDERVALPGVYRLGGLRWHVDVEAVRAGATVAPGP